MRRECRSVHDFEKICKISEGTYGVVYKVRARAYLGVWGGAVQRRPARLCWRPVSCRWHCVEESRNGCGVGPPLCARLGPPTLHPGQAQGGTESAASALSLPPHRLPLAAGVGRGKAALAAHASGTTAAPARHPPLPAQAREKSTGRIVALKRIKMEHETDGFPITSVREINILLNFHHENIVKVEEIVVSPT